MTLTGGCGMLLFARDFDRLLRFYRDGFGPLGLKHASGDEPGFIPGGPQYRLDENWSLFYLGDDLVTSTFFLELLDESVFAGAADPAGPPRANALMLSLPTSEIAAAVDRLLRSGASAPDGVVQEDWGPQRIFTHARLRDPEGNVIELFEPGE